MWLELRKQGGNDPVTGCDQTNKKLSWERNVTRPVGKIKRNLGQ